MNNKKRLSINVDYEVFEKFQEFCEWDKRSVNNAIIYLIKQCIRDFEKKDNIHYNQ